MIAIRKILRRKSIFIPVLFVLTAGFMMLAAAPTASASCLVDPVGHCSGTGYFTGAQEPPFTSMGQVILSGFTTDGADPAYRGDITRVSFVSGTNVVDKTSFINFINSQIAGGGRDATGGQFIVQLMRGGTNFNRPSGSDITDWENRINNPDIEIVFSVNEDWGHWNSGYMKGVANDDAFIYELGSSPALVFRSKSTGAVYFKLKTSCANPIGNMPGLPVAQHWDLSGASYVSTGAGSWVSNITASPGQTVAFHHRVSNSAGSTTATTVVTPHYSYNGATGALGSAVPAIAGGATWWWSMNVTIPSGATSGQKYCQLIDYSNATGPATAARGTGYACVTVAASGIDGVKIDDSKSGIYGGACAAVGVSAPGCSGTLAQYPFSNDAVTFSGMAGMPDNYFQTNSIPVGNHSISVPGGNTNGNWHVIGYSICDPAAVPDCSSANMAFGAKYFRASTSGITPVMYFANGRHYHMRWVYKYFAPGTFTVAANWGGSGFDNAENPTSFTPIGMAAVTFNYPNGALVAANVPLSYTAQYSIRRAGVEIPYPAPLKCSPLNGSITVTGRTTPGIYTVTGSVPSNCTASVPPLMAGDQGCVTYTFTPSSGTINALTGAEMSTNPAPVSTHNCYPPVMNEPYAHFFGLDVSAGGAFANGLGDQCSGGASGVGNIETFVKKGAPLAPAWGSSGQFAALATGDITQFSSASLRTPTRPKSPNDLTFANTVSPLGHLGVNHCVPDYFATKSASTPISSSASFDIGTASYNGNGNSAVEEQSAYSSPSGFTLKNSNGLGSGIAKGNRVAIYVTGDVYIQNNVQFKQTSWNSIDDIPSFYLIVKGNIYIDPSVTQLDGVYVAQPTSTGGGTIYTCAPGTPAVSSLFANTDLYNNCQNQLTVNGAFIANKVNLLRTANSVRNSLGGELPSGPGNCAGHDCAAEIFNFSPEVYLAQPGFNPIGGPSTGKYDYVTSLSPVL